jgi:hypothetical protein
LLLRRHLLLLHGVLELTSLVLHHLLELRVFLKLEGLSSQTKLDLLDAELIKELVKCLGLLHLHHRVNRLLRERIRRHSHLHPNLSLHLLPLDRHNILVCLLFADVQLRLSIHVGNGLLDRLLHGLHLAVPDFSLGTLLLRHEELH